MITIPKERTSQCYREIGGMIVYKRKLNTDKEAIAEAQRLNSKPNMIHKVIAYKCAICGKYHVGKSFKTLDKDNTLNKFVSTIVNNSKPLEQDTAKLIYKDFWKLI